MNLKRYLKDKFFFFLLLLIFYTIVILMFLAFKVPNQLIWGFSLTFIILIVLLFLIDYYRKKSFYKQFLNNLNRLDQKYLIIETVKEPNFYEGQILYQSLYDINKNMLEKIKDYETDINDFKEYIEMWIHEVKIPLASLTLVFHNHHKEVDRKISQAVKRIEYYVDQVLYYVRSKNANKDYLIKENNLSKVINKIALKNKDDLLDNNISLIVEDVNYEVLTDLKWLEFILDQIINNSIKYKRLGADSYIKISACNSADKIVLTIYDNGIGIASCDLTRVFEKSFTGENGRLTAKSTGMGLYIAKRLCEKLGHKIIIESQKQEYTKITIIFCKNDFYKIKD